MFSQKAPSFKEKHDNLKRILLNLHLYTSKLDFPFCLNYPEAWIFAKICMHIKSAFERAEISLA